MSITASAYARQAQDAQIGVPSGGGSTQSAANATERTPGRSHRGASHALGPSPSRGPISSPWSTRDPSTGTRWDRTRRPRPIPRSRRARGRAEEGCDPEPAGPRAPPRAPARDARFEARSRGPARRPCGATSRAGAVGQARVDPHSPPDPRPDSHVPLLRTHPTPGTARESTSGYMSPPQGDMRTLASDQPGGMRRKLAGCSSDREDGQTFSSADASLGW